MTKIICPLIYNHFSLSSSGERTLCCMSYYGLANEHDKVAYDFSYEQDRKKALDAFEIGKFPASCRGCEVAEQHGKKSYRQIVLEEFPETTKLIENNQVENIEIEYLDLKLGNKCNMACRMCNPQSSSLLEKENETSVMFLKNPKELNFDWPTKEKYWADINKQTAHLKKINLAGGEPFINKEGIGFLKSLVDSGKSKSIDLFINSNGSIYSEDLVKVLLSFKRVTIYFSVDGTKDTFEIIRFPMKWDFILKNLKKWASVACLNRNFEISLNPTVQIYNLFEIEELLTLVRSSSISNKL